MAEGVSRRSLLAQATALCGLVAAPALARPPRPLFLGDFSPLIAGIEAPEGIAVDAGGALVFSGDGAVFRLGPDGRSAELARPVAPNGLALGVDGQILVANMGRLKGLPGPLQRIDLASDHVETLVGELDGRKLTSTNDLAVARDGRVYCTHTGWGPVGNIGSPASDGFVYCRWPDGRAEVVARGLRSPNGIRLDAAGRHLYVSITAEARILRWPVLSDGRLGKAERFGPSLGETDPAHTVAALRELAGSQRAGLGYCDGINFDADGNLWITLPLANRIVVLTPAGRLVPIIHDPAGRLIDFPTNLCWSGPDMRQLNVVSRKGGAIVAALTARPGLRLL